MRLQLVILLKFTRATGHPHRYLRVGFGNYAGLLTKMSLPEADIARNLVEVGRDAGYSAEEITELRKRLEDSQ
jgi:hypothetical protein